MPNFRRPQVAGATYFSTHVVLHREGSDLLVRHIDFLRDAVAKVRRKHPFSIDAWVILPDHMHSVITLPPDDSDLALRMRLIKAAFSKSIPTNPTSHSISRKARGYRAIWQHRSWEHLIRDDDDFQRHVDYVHINPAKHGLVRRVLDWPYSTFHRFVECGIYPADWSGETIADLGYPD